MPLDSKIAIGLLIFATFLVVAIVFIRVGNKKREDGKNYFPLTIIGWIDLVLDVVITIVLFILYINEAGGITGVFIFTILSPLIIIAGFIVTLSIGITCLVEGYQKDDDGHINKKSVVRGWALLLLAILTLVAIIVTVTILFVNYSNSTGDTPIRTM